MKSEDPVPESEGSTSSDSSEEKDELLWRREVSRDTAKPLEYRTILRLTKYMKVTYIERERERERERRSSTYLSPLQSRVIYIYIYIDDPW